MFTLETSLTRLCLKLLAQTQSPQVVLGGSDFPQPVDLGDEAQNPAMPPTLQVGPDMGDMTPVCACGSVLVLGHTQRAVSEWKL